MDVNLLNEYFDHVHQLTVECGEILKNVVHQTKVVETKSNRMDFVTEYDKKVEEILMNGILEKYPDHKFVAEESSYGKQLPELTDAPTWLIDPIDGTGNFVKNIRLICISIGLTINKELVASICYNPWMDEMYTAKKGQGAYLNGKQIHVSNCKETADALFAFTLIPIPSEPNPQKLMARAGALLRLSTGCRIFGSVAITLCYIASGLIDAYNVENVGPWDTAGGILLVTEAGGVVKDVSGGPYNIMKPKLVVAATDELCNQIIQVINDVNAKF